MEHHEARALLARIAVQSESRTLPRAPDWVSAVLPGGMFMEEAAFDRLLHAAREFGDREAYVLEVETLEHDFPPLRIALTHSALEPLHQEMLSHFECVLVPLSGRWFAHLGIDDRAVIHGPPAFIARLA